MTRRPFIMVVPRVDVLPKAGGMFSSPHCLLLQAVITFKWNTFARRLLLVELAFFMLWLVGFNTFTILFQVRPLSCSWLLPFRLVNM